MFVTQRLPAKRRMGKHPVVFLDVLPSYLQRQFRTFLLEFSHSDGKVVWHGHGSRDDDGIRPAVQDDCGVSVIHVDQTNLRRRQAGRRDEFLFW